MLADGELDAIFSATKPSSFDTAPEKVTHLFPNYKEVEADYYARTNIFPIMHVVAIKRAVYEANPWIAKTLTKAFGKALDMAYEPLQERAALRYMLPWLDDHVTETKKLMGGKEKWWQDGFEENKHVLEKFLEYSFNQGLAKRKFKPEELFAPSSLESYVL
jgi:4,5-dihydroxyphthalate decarboxylase